MTGQMERMLGASVEHRALTTAMLSAVADVVDADPMVVWHSPAAVLHALASDRRYARTWVQVLETLRLLGMSDEPSDREVALLLSSVQVAIFVCHYSEMLADEPEDVWQRFVADMINTEQALAS